MKIEAQRFLELVELANTAAFVDIEATGLRGDYNSVLCVSIRPFRGKPEVFAVERAGEDRAVVKAVKKAMEKYDLWVTYYGKGFDLPMLNTRLLQHCSMPIEPRHHLDMYYMLKSRLLTARRSQGHILSWLKTPEQKMGVSAEVWNMVLANPKREMPKMIARCNSDTEGLMALFRRTSHLVRDLTR